MKYLKYITVALLAITAISSCKKNNPDENGGWTSEGSVTGSWHMISWAGLTTADIYVSFNENGTYDLYQRLYSPIYEHLTGSWSLNGGIISGNYDDGTAWRTDYNVLISDSGEEMTLTATGNADDTATYGKAEIPEEILSGDLSLKSSENGEDTEPQDFRFL